MECKIYNQSPGPTKSYIYYIQCVCVIGNSFRTSLTGHLESGVVQWLRVETRDREVRVQFPAPAVVSDLVVACHSS